MTENQEKALKREGWNKFQHIQSRYFYEWFNKLNVEEKRILFEEDCKPPFRNLNNINYLPDGYYISQFMELKDIVRVKKNRVFFHIADHSEEVELYFKDRKLLEGFSLEEVLKRFRTICN